MALIGNFTVNDQDYPNAYAKLLYSQADAGGVHIFVNVYTDEDHRQQDFGHPLAQRLVEAQRSDMTDPDPIVSGYAFLKNNVPFLGWQDA